MKRTGKYAYVNGVPCTTSWQSSITSQTSRYNASCAPGGTATASGNQSETGSMTGIGYAPPMPDDDDFAFVGVASAKPGEIVNYEGSVLIYETSLAIPVKQGGVITWSSNFGVQGLLEKTTIDQYLDATREVGPSAKFGGIKIEGTPDSDTWTDVVVQGINITFRRPVTETVEDGVILREAGDLEADLNFMVESDDREVALYALATKKRVRVYVTPTTFFEFDCIEWGEKSNFTVTRQGAQMIGYQVNGMWSALRDQDPAALGYILLPDGSTFYGDEES